jgi:hypothetical protein
MTAIWRHSCGAAHTASGPPRPCPTCGWDGGYWSTLVDEAPRFAGWNLPGFGTPAVASGGLSGSANAAAAGEVGETGGFVGVPVAEYAALRALEDAARAVGAHLRSTWGYDVGSDWFHPTTRALVAAVDALPPREQT